jgi:hypothetical protein
MLSQYIAKCKYTFKMIQIIAKLDKIWIIYLIWIDSTISIIIEIFDSCDFIKNKFGVQVFHLNEHKRVFKKKLLKIYFHLK